MVKTRSSASSTAPPELKGCCSGRRKRRRHGVTMPHRKRKVRSSQQNKAVVDTKPASAHCEKPSSASTDVAGDILETKPLSKCNTPKDSTDQKLLEREGKIRVSRHESLKKTASLENFIENICSDKKISSSVSICTEKSAFVSPQHKQKHEEDSDMDCGGSKDQGKGWTAEQDLALQNAYFQVRPSSNFWFEVSKKVAGKTAKECFDRYYSAYPTPPIAQPRTRKAATESPVRTISFSSPLPSKPRFGRGKQGLVKAHQTVRHILRQQTVADGGYEADVFTAVEDYLPEGSKDVFFSPSSTFEENSESCYGTPADNTDDWKNCKAELSSVSSKACTKFHKQIGVGDQPFPSPNVYKREIFSPEVLKRETNPARLDKYLDMLHLRRIDKKRSSKKGTLQYYSKENKENSDCNITLSAARNAIISSANEVLRSLTQKDTVEEENSSFTDDAEDDLMDYLDD